MSASIRIPIDRSPVGAGSYSGPDPDFLSERAPPRDRDGVDGSRRAIHRGCDRAVRHPVATGLADEDLVAARHGEIKAIASPIENVLRSFTG